MICYVKYLPDPIWWSGVYDSITMHSSIFGMYVGPMKVKESFDIMFFIHSTKQNAGVLVDH